MKFIVKQAGSGQFMFNIVAANGQTVATSEQYSAKASALDTIESIKESAGTAAVVDETAA